MKNNLFSRTLLAVMSATLISCIGDNNGQTSSNASSQPNENYDFILSPNGPNAPIKELYNIKLQKPEQELKIREATYTYIRCYYPKHPQKYLQMRQTNPETDYVWATNKNGSYLKLNGYWHSDGVLALRNWFYTDKTSEYVKDVCDETVKREISNDNFSFYQVAANNNMSYNHTIWFNDEKYIPNNKIDKIISFGDSLSDINNMYNMSNWLLPNRASWFQGRFSNGLTWVEYLSQKMEIPLYNRAIGGSAGNTQKLIIPGLTNQVDLWIDYLADAKNYNPQKTLATILIGGNDFITYNRNVNDLIIDVNDGLTELAQHNVGHILVLNLPDITSAPIFSIENRDKSEVFNKVIEYNQKLTILINSLQTKYPNTQFKLVDTKAILDEIIQNHKQYEIENVNDSCLDMNSGSPTKYITHHEVSYSCTNPAKFLFWDALQITTKAHSLLADIIYQQYISSTSTK